MCLGQDGILAATMRQRTTGHKEQGTRNKSIRDVHISLSSSDMSRTRIKMIVRRQSDNGRNHLPTGKYPHDNSVRQVNQISSFGSRETKRQDEEDKVKTYIRNTTRRSRAWGCGRHLRRTEREPSSKATWLKGSFVEARNGHVVALMEGTIRDGHSCRGAQRAFYSYSTSTESAPR